MSAAGQHDAAEVRQRTSLAAYLAGRRRERIQNYVLPVVGIGLLLFGWWAVVAGFHVRPFIAPSPLLVARTLIRNRGLLFDNLIPTTVEAVGGFLAGNLAAILVAIVFVEVKVLEKIFFPVAVMLNSIPVVAKAPILILIMGSGLELMQILSASRMQILFKVRFYNSLPYLFSSMRIAASMSVIGAVVGEWIGSTKGIGALILQATYAFDTGLLYSAILMSTLLAGAFFVVIAYFEKITIVWPAEAPH
jgi:NitT/TauT family transport system permease protein